MLISQTGPARHNRAVILNGDENVVDYARFVFWQIAKNEPERDYDLVFCTPVKGLDARHPHLPEIRNCEVSTKGLEDIPTRPTIPLACHIKVALPEIFRADYKQIVYLDTDVYLRHGKISQLFDLASPDKPVSAVLDGIQWRDRVYEAARRSWTALGIVDTKYFNAGMLVYNVEAYCKADIKSGVVGFAADNGHLFAFTDQDASNGHLKGDWHPLPLEWNWQSSASAFHLIRKYNPKLLHFVGTTKPYISEAPRFSRRFRKSYAAFFNQILQKPFAPIVQPSNTPGKAPKARFTLQKLLVLINKVNPFAYTFLGGMRETITMRRNIDEISRAIRNGTKLWPPDARKRQEPDD